ncbi:SEC-C metal-binding domain-containing protein [Lentibacillus salicampi]|uniref:Zinc chelation protein SecC n=1 Tax=Lentibacillus salicampi TaxID=175306 RepID=A0A4Y9AFC5_9BACI|nr:hypothetical protein E4U82_02360 [Lentibacillus salicampi]
MKSVEIDALQAGKKTNEFVQEKPKRNASCLCGNGKKYKKCCGE